MSIPHFQIRSGAISKDFESIDSNSTVQNPLDVPDFVPSQSFDGDELGYDLSKGERLFVSNYFAQLTNENFHKEQVTALCTFEDTHRRQTADGNYLRKKVIVVTGAANGNVKLWNILKGKFSKDLLFHSQKVKAIVAYTPPQASLQGGPQNGSQGGAQGSSQGGRTRIITGGEDKMIVVWDYHSGTVFAKFQREDAVHCLAVCNKTGLLAAGTADRKIALYMVAGDKYADMKLIEQIETIHTDLILSLGILSPDDSIDHSKIVSVGWDKRMVVWNRFAKKVSQFEKGHTKSITALVAHTPSGEEATGEEGAPILITGSLDKTAIIWDFTTGKKVRVLEGHTGQVNAIKVCDRNDDGSPPIVLTASVDKTLILWDLLTGSRIRTIESLEPLNTLAIIDSPEGIIAISSGTSQSLLLWDLRRTHRSRKFATKAVTSIDVYSPPGKQPLVVIGDVDRKFTVFDFSDNRNPLFSREFNAKRINAGIIYTFLEDREHPEETPLPLVVSADGNAEIKVWSLDVTIPPNTPKKTLTGHAVVVLTVAIYDPTLFGRSRESDLVRPIGNTGNERIDLRVPCLLSGGGDKSIKVWDFLGLLGSGDLIGEIPLAHAANVRSIVVYHPCDPAEKPLFISGSYDKTTILWNLETLEKLYTFDNGVHTDYVFFTAIYDPKTQYLPTGSLPKEKIHPAVITSSYDFSFAVWDMVDKNVRMHKKNAHKDSITALAVYTPPHNSSEDPLVITGSIDRLIHIWNLFTGVKVQTLVGHTDRVCYIKIYDPPGKHPLIFSGGDDEQTILWEDSLYQKPFMPLRESVIRAFESDLESTDWPMITEMAETYGSLVFIENSNLFTVAVLRDRADFLLKFWDYLTLTLPTIKSESIDKRQTDTWQNSPNVSPASAEPAGPSYDILSIAIRRCDLVSVRAIVLSWIKNLNQDMDSMLTQRVYHASYFFPDAALERLYQYYPSEFLRFITSLRLVRNYHVLMGGKQRKYLNSASRYEFQASTSRVDNYLDFWKDFTISATYSPKDVFSKKNWLDRFLVELDLQIIRIFQSIDRFFDVPIEPQPVTSMMVPFKNCNKVYDYLKMFVSVSNQLNDVSIFNSEIGMVFLRYFWHIRGRGIHVLAFFKYLLFSTLFLICIYSYEPNYHNFPEIITISFICIAGFAWYGYEEFSQMKKMLGTISPYHMITHFADLWNAVDLIIVVTGIIGLILRISYDCDTSTGRACLAVASVFMWFKMLYFLRPFSTTGPLVAMILQIAMEIRTFLFVLFCVLAGFAQAFWILSNNDETMLFGTVSQSFLNSFLYMLGQNVVADFTGTASPFVATVFLIFFLITMMILMLNLLIALMGDVFSKVRAEGVALWRKEQAAIILEESFMDVTDDKIPPHLLVLKYTSEVSNSKVNFKEELKKLISTSDVPAFTPLKIKEKEEDLENAKECKDDGKSDGKAAK